MQPAIALVTCHVPRHTSVPKNDCPSRPFSSESSIYPVSTNFLGARQGWAQVAPAWTLAQACAYAPEAAPPSPLREGIPTRYLSTPRQSLWPPPILPHDSLSAFVLLRRSLQQIDAPSPQPHCPLCRLRQHTELPNTMGLKVVNNSLQQANLHHSEQSGESCKLHVCSYSFNYPLSF